MIVYGPCADKIVTCTLVTVYGEHFIGTNSCASPQPVCPREPGEDYAKCKTICHQHGHAEEQALEKAGVRAVGAIAYLQGITFICRSCQEQLIAAGVTTFKFEKPPLYTGFQHKERSYARLHITD